MMRWEGVFPLEIGPLWGLLHAHLDDDKIGEIHPWMLRSRTTHEGARVDHDGLSFPGTKVAERVVRLGGRTTRTTWRYWVEPPQRYRYEATFANGSVTAFDNVYAPAKGGTLVKTDGVVSIRRMPSFLAKWLVERSLNRTEDEDLEYARKMHL